MSVNLISGSPYDPLAGFKISDIDASGDPKFYGYLDYDGNWYIMKETGGAYRFARGSSNYSTNWTGRAGLSYGYFNAVF